MQAIARSKIAISLHRVSLGIEWWDVCFSDSVAKLMSSAGCMAICDDMPGHDDYFGDEMIVFSDIPELLGRIDWYLEHEDVRRRIAEEQCEVVANNFTRTVRTKALVRHIEMNAPREYIASESRRKDLDSMEKKNG